MSLELLVTIGIAIEGLQFAALGWLATRLVGIERELGGVQVKLTEISRRLGSSGLR